MHLGYFTRIKITTGQKYKHYKGNIYEFLSLATHSETGEELVIYRGKNGIWARPFDMFFGYLDDGRKRFTLIPEEEEMN